MRDIRRGLATNKRRGTTMERRVMQRLGGNRVPMSGAGAIKGDGMLYKSFGLILVECKSTAAATEKKGKKMSLQYSWLLKLEKEVKVMKARFGVLIIHYHGDSHDYVLVPVADYEKHFPKPRELVFTIENTKNISSTCLTKNVISVVERGVALVKVPFNEFYLLRLDAFIEVLDQREAENERLVKRMEEEVRAANEQADRGSV